MPLYQKLIERLAELFPTIESSQLMLTYSNIPMGDIAFNAAAEINWMNIVNRVEVRGKLGVLIQTIVDKYEDERLWEYAMSETPNTILKDASKVYKEELNQDKEITGLNVPHRIGYEKAMGGRDDSVYIEWLAKALETSNIVCKVELSTGGTGTGFLIEGGYVMTNHHVICKYFPRMFQCDYKCEESHDCPLRGRIILGYQTSQTRVSQTTYNLDPTHTYIVNEPLDYALIKVKDNPEHPISNWGFAKFESFKLPQEGDRVNIVQHPKGERKKMAMPDPVVSLWEDENWLFYSGDTDEGSSGSPVFNQNWDVVAVHHGGIKESEGGIEINAAGEKKEANRGTLIGAIIKDLKSKGITI